MAFCYMISIAGSHNSHTAQLAQALREAYSHRKVTVLNMESYRKEEQELPLAELGSGLSYRDYYSPESFDLESMRRDIEAIMEKVTCRILIVEGLLTLSDAWIEEVSDVRVYVNTAADIRVLRHLDREMEAGLSYQEASEKYLELVRARHEQYVRPFVEQADIVVDDEKGVEQGVWQIRKALRGLML